MLNTVKEDASFRINLDVKYHKLHTQFFLHLNLKPYQLHVSSLTLPQYKTLENWEGL